MPLPGRVSRWASSQASRDAASGRASTPSRSEVRASGPRTVVTGTGAPPGPAVSCASTSSTTRLLAVAVVARTGVPEGSSPSRSRMRR